MWAKIKSVETLEEVGSNITIEREIGKVIEFRSKWNIKQISYCYSGKIISKGVPTFTEKEKREGFKLLWTPVDKVVAMLENDKPTNYAGSFIQQRDLVFVKKFLGIDYGKK